MLHLKNFSKDFVGKPLFSSISWHLKKGERVGLVGENGAGKTTLMRIIAGEVEASSGETQFAKGATAGYLPQDGIITRGKPLFQEVMGALADLQQMEKELDSLTKELEQVSHNSPDYTGMLEKYGGLQEEFRIKGGYSKESEVAIVLNGLGFLTSEWDKDCGTFSGGWQMRIALAKLLLKKPNLLLLDEPTNHLDIEARNWLESYLCSYPFSVILVSHDHFFLDAVCHKISEVWNHTITDYHCNYTNYLVQREARVDAIREAKKRQDEEVEKLEDFINRFRYKADKAALVQSRIKQLEKIERIIIPPERRKIHFKFPEPPKSGRIAMELNGVTKSYGSLKVLDRVSLTIEKGERIALVGHNGAGKSTLMKLLAGGEFQAGERTAGHNVVIDYFAQDQSDSLDGSKTVYEELYSEAPYDMVPKLRDMLGAFLFSGDDIEKKVSVLSGGERNRLALAKMLLRPSNLLLMDEPTNHLDLFSKEMLLDALRDFQGTVVFVSHDRHFIDGLATRVVEVDKGNLNSYIGDYEYYLAKKNGAEAVVTETAAKSQVVTKEERLKEKEEEKRQQKEERSRLKKVAELEKSIEAAEKDIRELEERLADPETANDYVLLQKIGDEHREASSRLAEFYQEWEALTS
ncbi:MAG: ABC-F family ATP-binding cassette domain-containing protein [Desulfuromonadales bacterium]|nr:ABC-F family ATP-binding cassette domain-containing protein [Desulfuromonadales bacterium]